MSGSYREPRDVAPPRCARCPAEREGADPAWSRGPEGWLCPDCTRRHLRDIEAKLAPEWW